MRNKTITGLDKWFVEYEMDEAELLATAQVYIPIDGSHSKVVSVCTMDCLELEGDGDNLQLIRDGSGADRLKWLAMIVHAPDMLDCIRRCAKRLERATDDLDDGLERDLPITPEEIHDLWVSLCEVQRELYEVDDLSSSTESI